MMVVLEIECVRQGFVILSAQPPSEQCSLRLVGDYSMPNVSERTCRTIHSYSDYVNCVVLKKH